MVDSNDWSFVIFLLILLIYHVFTSLLYYLGAHHMVDSNDWSFEQAADMAVKECKCLSLIAHLHITTQLRTSFISLLHVKLDNYTMENKFHFHVTYENILFL